MIDINLRDPNLIGNFKALQELRKTGIFTDGQLQKMYNEQVERDKMEEIENDDTKNSISTFNGDRSVR